MPKYKKKRFNLGTILVGMGLDPFKDGKKRCPKCGNYFEACSLCRGQHNHQRCISDDVCHECTMKKKWG